MEKKKQILWELGIVAIFIVFWFFFVQTNSSQTLGTIYIGLAVGSIVIAMIDHQYGRKQIYLVNPSYSWIASFIIGVIGYFVVIFGGQVLVQLLKGIPLSNALNLLAATSPAFGNSVIINKITFGLMVSYIETYALFVVGYDLLASMFNIDIDIKNLKNPKLIGIIVGLVALFLLLHVTAKGIENQSALIIVAFMAFVSLIIVTITKEGRSAIILHQVANSISVFLT